MRVCRRAARTGQIGIRSDSDFSSRCTRTGHGWRKEFDRGRVHHIIVETRGRRASATRNDAIPAKDRLAIRAAPRRISGCERLMVAGIGHRKERNRRRSGLDFQFLLVSKDIRTPRKACKTAKVITEAQDVLLFCRRFENATDCIYSSVANRIMLE